MAFERTPRSRVIDHAIRLETLLAAAVERHGPLEFSIAELQAARSKVPRCRPASYGLRVDAEER